MASSQETVALELYRCYHCGLESAESSFKYFDNKKADQPRYKCHHCHKLFTLGSHGRPQGKTYAKKRNEDPDELKCLSRQCRHCGVADNALFKYYNNHNISQPRFKCLSCGKQFQMRLLGTGEERRLVHTSSKAQTRAPHCQKQGVPEPLPNASNGFEDGSYQPLDGSFMPVPYDPVMFTEPGTTWFPETVSGEDVQNSNIHDPPMAIAEENHEANFTSWTGNSEPSPLSDEDAQFGDLLEAELLAQEDNEGSNDDALSSTANITDELPHTWSSEDAISSTANGADALPPAWSNEDANLMNFTGFGMRYNEAPYGVMVSDNVAEMDSESTCSNGVEAMYGTRALEGPAASGFEPWTWTQNDTSVDPYLMNYAEAPPASSRQMDSEVAIENSMEEIDTSVDPYRMNYADMAKGIPWSRLPQPSPLLQSVSPHGMEMALWIS